MAPDSDEPVERAEPGCVSLNLFRALGSKIALSANPCRCGSPDKAMISV